MQCGDLDIECLQQTRDSSPIRSCDPLDPSPETTEEADGRARLRLVEDVLRSPHQRIPGTRGQRGSVIDYGALAVDLDRVHTRRRLAAVGGREHEAPEVPPYRLVDRGAALQVEPALRLTFEVGDQGIEIFPVATRAELALPHHLDHGRAADEILHRPPGQLGEVLEQTLHRPPGQGDDEPAHLLQDQEERSERPQLMTLRSLGILDLEGETVEERDRTIRQIGHRRRRRWRLDGARRDGKPALVIDDLLQWQGRAAADSNVGTSQAELGAVAEDHARAEIVESATLHLGEHAQYDGGLGGEVTDEVGSRRREGGGEMLV